MRWVRMIPMTLVMAAGVCSVARGQAGAAAMGTVATQDADLSGGLEVHGAVARLVSNVSLAAYEHNAPVELARGGRVLICSTSSLHLLRSGTGGALLFGLDRGALEIQSQSQPQDSILTPDLRFTLRTQGPLDLRLRVTREGDTCVDNRGAGAPVLQVSEAFGTATYYVAPGQHVLFEHGSVHAVVDKERSDCGCPVAAAPVAVAGNATAVGTAAQAAVLHPFPAAQSADLAPTTPPVPLPAVPADTTLTYGGTAAPAATMASATATAVAPVAAPTQASPPSTPVAQTAPSGPPPSPPGIRAIAHSVGGFFRRLFRRGEKQ